MVETGKNKQFNIVALKDGSTHMLACSWDWHSVRRAILGIPDTAEDFADGEDAIMSDGTVQFTILPCYGADYTTHIVVHYSQISYFETKANE